MAPHDHTHEHHHETNRQDIPADRQAVCPVTGDAVDRQEAEAHGRVREFEGTNYYLCCNTCVQLFDKDPGKYAGSRLEADALKLIEKEQLSDNLWAFRFKPNIDLAWTPGQFVRVELPHDNPDDEGVRRFFTISSAPYEGIVQITTRISDSTFKQALAALPVGGDLLLLDMPDGDFVWEEESDRPLVFVAGGIGITPFRSMLRQRAHDNLPLAATLIYANRTDAIAFKDEFDGYADQDAAFTVHYLTGERLSAEKLHELVPGINGTLVYVSGPEPMVESIGNDLKAAGLPAERLKQDYFPNYTEINY